MDGKLIQDRITKIIHDKDPGAEAYLFDYRQKGDYGDMFDYDEEIAEPLIDQVKEFIKKINENI